MKEGHTKRGEKKGSIKDIATQPSKTSTIAAVEKRSIISQKHIKRFREIIDSQRKKKEIYRAREGQGGGKKDVMLGYFVNLLHQLGREGLGKGKFLGGKKEMKERRWLRRLGVEGFYLLVSSEHWSSRGEKGEMGPMEDWNNSRGGSTSSKTCCFSSDLRKPAPPSSSRARSKGALIKERT